MLNSVCTRFVGCVLLLGLWVGAGCVGGGSGTGNATTIAGQVVDPSGMGVGKARVTLYESNSIPVLPTDTGSTALDHATADTSGNYVFSNVPQGQYNIDARDSSQTWRHLTLNTVVKPGDYIWVGHDTLRLTQTFIASVSNPQPVPTYCFVYGSPYIAARNDTTGLFVLPDLPVGSYDIQFKTLPDSLVNCSASFRLTQLPDTTTVVSVTLECQ